MGFTGGDTQRLHTAALALAPDAGTAQAHSRAAAAFGAQVAAAAGHPHVAGAADSFAWSLTQAIAATGTALGRLSSTSGTEGDGLSDAGQR